VVDLRESITPFLSFIDQLPCSTAVILNENMKIWLKMLEKNTDQVIDDDITLPFLLNILCS
jgi:hypothetical protein